MWLDLKTFLFFFVETLFVEVKCHKNLILKATREYEIQIICFDIVSFLIIFYLLLASIILSCYAKKNIIGKLDLSNLIFLLLTDNYNFTYYCHWSKFYNRSL